MTTEDTAKIEIVYSNGSSELLDADTHIRSLWALFVDCTELGAYENRPDDDGTETTPAEMLRELRVCNSKSWFLVGNEDGGGWTVVDHDATIAANTRRHAEVEGRKDFEDGGAGDDEAYINALGMEKISKAIGISAQVFDADVWSKAFRAGYDAARAEAL